MPYVAGSSHLIGDRDPNDPFIAGGNFDGRVGLDAKIGLGSKVTLEARNAATSLGQGLVVEQAAELAGTPQVSNSGLDTSNP